MTTASRQRRIAVVSDAVYPYNKGGKETRIHQLTTRLAELGYEVHIYTMKWWEGAPDRLEQGVHLHGLSHHYPLYHGARRSIRQGLFFGLAVLKLLWRGQFDILEVDHMPFFPLYSAKLVSLVRRRPLHATWHEVWGPAYWQEYLGPLGRLAYLVEKFSVYLPDHITAVSPATAEQLRRLLHYRRSLTVVPNGIDLADITATQPAQPASDIIFAGRLLEHKHVDDLIRAVALLRPNHPQLRCLIVGDGPERARLQRLVTELNLQNHLTFTGFVKHHHEVYGLMKSSRVFVLPSTREGFGIAALEANACGLPVVTTNDPGNGTRELITAANGLLCSPGPSALAAAINQVLTQPPARPEQTAQAYDWRRIVPQAEEAWLS